MAGRLPSLACRRIGAALLGAMLLAAPARAEDPPHAGDLQRLAEILGALSHLDTVCSGRAGSIWREKMSNFLQVEAPPPELRRRYIAAYNRANREFAALYRDCTPRAADLVQRYLDEGARLSRRLSTDK
ncbi:TIGR02301 family protein [Methylobrevis pamukkalensis]|uniref:TIGR02301 family protein n=1 Tax=Methylobrevis pamukkalensis TaxID=1439726 RepID=A0A1E3H3P9_9HYPH|nr:TIGR02301 family protein [Methylobrevis pamukkalensis]ODN70949.1 hypothetical protein A6302_01721 [Methylobrevis pamukkalensis]